MSDISITVTYCCRECGLQKIEVTVPARENEDIAAWVDALGHKLAEDHAGRSPDCHIQTLYDIMIPVTAAERAADQRYNKEKITEQGQKMIGLMGIAVDGTLVTPKGRRLFRVPLKLAWFILRLQHFIALRGRDYG